MSRADGILHLVLNALPWDEIAAGRKPVEYRRRQWLHRLNRGEYRFVRLQRAFQKIDGKVPTMLFRIAEIDVGPANPQYTYGIVPEGEQFARIWLGERIQ